MHPFLIFAQEMCYDKCVSQHTLIVDISISNEILLYFCNIKQCVWFKHSQCPDLIFTNKKIFKNMILRSVCVIMYYKFIYFWESD